MKRISNRYKGIGRPRQTDYEYNDDLKTDAGTFFTIAAIGAYFAIVIAALHAFIL